uniref:tRNA-uridine aminocarboxypropyltransferase n=1 Tax=Leptobrachium leishanense TaxID=445787 RepID=A0A8C5PBK8_9ANUR
MRKMLSVACLLFQLSWILIVEHYAQDADIILFFIIFRIEAATLKGPFKVRTEAELVGHLFRRPQKVCLCPFLPEQPLPVSTCLYIVQHPAEESRVLRTVPLLVACLAEDKCKVLIGRRFGEERYPDLASVCKNPSTFILYPGAEASNLEDLPRTDVQHPCSLIIIDGTWSQAKDIFYKNSLFRLPKQVQLKSSLSSQYVIRTQPTNMCLSTLECAAVALSIMERNAEIQETILRPLQAMCTFQLQHGAQIHHSKEHLIKMGLYAKQMPKNKRKLKKMQFMVDNVKI